MSKRRNTSSAEPDSPPSKRRYSGNYDSDDEHHQYEESKIDTNTGLAGAFPGLKDDDILFYGPANDGLDYLRMVRSEAKNIPNLLSATTSNEILHEKEYEGFFDEDQAFIAVAIPEEQTERSVGRAQQIYSDTILSRFKNLRSHLRDVPPLEYIKSLPNGTPISFPSSSKNAREIWENYILKCPPNPVQIASMDSDSIMELIRFFTKRMRKFLRSLAEEDVQRMGSWLWAALAKCRDRGELGSEEISDLRAFAKAAYETLQWLGQKNQTSVRAHDEGDEMNDEDASSHISEDNENHQEGQRGLQKLIDAGGTSKSAAPHFGKRHVILDMIITIVGETYGQRDLLELRRPWQTIDQC